jgi:hypothetical protein
LFTQSARQRPWAGPKAKGRHAATGAAAAIAVMLVLLIPAPAAAGGFSMIFNVKEDFRVSPNQANPNGPWSFRMRTSSGSKPLLNEFWTDHFGIEGLQTWHGQHISTSQKDKLPFVGVNATGTLQTPLGITWPAGALLVHPGATRQVIIRWTAPRTGQIRFRAALIDRDSCGDGVHWVFQIGNQPAIAQGNLDNAVVKVRSGSYVLTGGEHLELRVGIRGTNSCDSTQVRLRIAFSQVL